MSHDREFTSEPRAERGGATRPCCSSDAGARDSAGNVGKLLTIVAVVWSLFQVLLASSLANYILPGDVINNSRQVHLAFAVFLAFLAYPAFKSSPRNYIPMAD